MEENEKAVVRRVLIERLPNGFVNVRLQRKTRFYWKTQAKTIIPPERADKTNPDSTIALLLRSYERMYGLHFDDAIDTRFEYKDISLMAAIMLELKISMYKYVWRRKFNKARNEAIFRYLMSGVDKHTRSRYYVIQGSDGEPAVVCSKEITQLKKVRKINKNASHLDFEKESLFSVHNLSDEALKHEKMYQKYIETRKPKTENKEKEQETEAAKQK